MVEKKIDFICSDYSIIRNLHFDSFSVTTFAFRFISRVTIMDSDPCMIKFSNPDLI